jgi:hypothetical protein
MATEGGGRGRVTAPKDFFSPRTDNYVLLKWMDLRGFF